MQEYLQNMTRFYTENKSYCIRFNRVGITRDGRKEVTWVQILTSEQLRLGKGI